VPILYWASNGNVVMRKFSGFMETLFNRLA